MPSIVMLSIWGVGSSSNTLAIAERIPRVRATQKGCAPQPAARTSQNKSCRDSYLCRLWRAGAADCSCSPVTVAITLRPVCPSTLKGCKVNELLSPP